MKQPPMAWLDKIGTTLAQLPPSTLEQIHTVIDAIVKSEDPQRAAKRAAMAAASSQISAETLRELLP